MYSRLIANKQYGRKKSVELNIEQKCVMLCSMIEHLMQYEMEDDEYAAHLPTSDLRPVGFFKLGGGYFSIALEHPMLGDDYVIKVQMRPDSGYEAYSKYCMDNPNKHLPDIVHHHVGKKFKVYVIRRYSDIKTVYEHVDIMTLDKYIHNLLVGTKSKLCINVLGDSLVQTIQDIVKHFENLCVRWDVHQGNFMYCNKNNCIVLTDIMSHCETKLSQSTIRSF